MNKETVLGCKHHDIECLHTQIATIEKLERGRLYRFNFSYTRYETWGYVLNFNLDSVRFCVIASDNPDFSDAVNSRFRYRNDTMTVGYLHAHAVTPAKRSDLPLLLGLTNRLQGLEKLFKGKSRVKVLDD